ncbi:MAG: hypothetical protein JO247_22400 [Chloroflexi bacterium]|nr:hypothetical protein [Chloroflexota bacterium]
MTATQPSNLWTPRELVHLLLLASDMPPSREAERLQWRLRVLLISTECRPQVTAEPLIS